MLRARSAAEAHLYMDLHPCACGEARFAREHRLIDAGEDLASVYEGPCAGCGASRRFEILLPDGAAAPHWPSYGGAEPSTILDPGEFLAASEQAARSVPASPEAVAPGDRRAARERLEAAAAAVEEVLKFIPPDAERVPADALRSARSKEMYLAEPGRFRRPRLEAVLAAYRRLLQEYGR